MLGKLKKKAVPGAETRPFSALSYSIRIVWGENVSRRREVSWACTERHAWSRERRNKVSRAACHSPQPEPPWPPGFAASASTRTRQGRRSEGAFWAVVMLSPGRASARIPAAREASGLLGPFPHSNNCGSRRNKTENLNKMFAHIPPIFLNLHWKLAPICRHMKDLQ